MVELSVVVPVYKCGGCLRALHARLVSTLDDLGRSYELVFVDDRSPDDGWETLSELADSDSSVQLVRLSRNFGQHAAITAGLTEASGEWVIVMDCDLEDRPEEIPRLWAKAQEGYDIVFAARRGRTSSRLRLLASRAYAGLLNVAVGTRLDPRLGNFSIISRKVCDAFLQLKERDRQYLMILHWLGFESTSIEVEQGSRHAGASAYTLSMLVRFALDGVFFQTTVLLRWIVYIGFAMATGGALLALFLVLNYFFRDPYPGWTSLGVLLLVIGGFIIASTGVAGLYIGRIYTQVKDRPLFVVDAVVRGGEQQRADREAVAAGASSGAVEP